MQNVKTKRLAIGSLFVALTAVCAQITIPTPAIPFSLSLLPVFLCGALLGPGDAFLAMGAYLLMGLIGLPVFSNLTGGAGKLLGVTGGYILGYLPCVAAEAWIIRKLGRSFHFMVLAMICGLFACYALGTVWFAVTKHTDLAVALNLCVWPFLIGDLAKILLSAFLAGRLQEPLSRMGFCSH